MTHSAEIHLIVQTKLDFSEKTQWDFFFFLSLWDLAEINAQTDTKKPSRGNAKENAWLSRQEILYMANFIIIFILSLYIIHQ